MSRGVSGFYEAFYLRCEIGIVDSTVASWDVYFSYFNDDGIELSGDSFYVRYVGSVQCGKKVFCVFCKFIPVCLFVVCKGFALCFEFLGDAGGYDDW